jgi:cytochrome c oxidase cbb3-type subunit 4
MTPTDWVGLLTSVVAFLVMVGLYVWVFNPKNKKTFESQRHIPMDSDDFDSEEKQ